MLVAACLGFWQAAVALAIEGRVVMPDGEPLAGARILVVERGDTVLADGQGRFELPSPPQPPFVLFVARPDGVALRPVTILELPAEGPLEVRVAPAGETVTVVSGVIPDLELAPASAATVMGRGDLEQRLPSRLFESLENLPGSEVGGDGPAAVPSLRGMPQHRTLLLLDDGRVRAERRAGPSASFLDPETIDEVEVVRGPGSVAYGSDAFGGVIRSRTRMPDPSGAQELRWSLVGGTGIDELGAAAEFSAGLLGGGAMLGAHYRDWGNYSSPEGTVLDSGSRLQGFRLGWQAVAAGGVMHLLWRSDEARDAGKPGPDSAVRRTYYPTESSDRLSFGFERPGPGSWSRLGLSLSWNDYLVVLAKDRYATATTPRDLAESRVDARDYSLRADAERPLGEWRLVLGLDLNGRYDLEAVNEYTTYDLAGEVAESRSETSIESARGTDSGLFSSLGRRLGRWSFDLGARGDVVTSRNEGGAVGDRSTSSTALSGFAAVGLDLGAGLELTAQAARGFRDPLLSDRYYVGESGRGFIYGNPELEPETSRQLDLALRYSADGLAAAVYAYAYRIENLIERYRIGNDFFFRNRGEAEIRGLELELSVTLTAGLELQLGGHLLSGEVLDDGTATDGVPAPGGFVVLRGSPSPRWWWMARGAAFMRDDRPGPTEQEVAGYGVLDAGAGYRVADWLELSVLGRNLLDHSYLGSSDEAAVLAPGRSLQVVLRGRL
jgi:outer membrane receptor protein involved in Fe transport